MKSKLERARIVRRKYNKLLTKLKWKIQLWKNKEECHKDSLAQMDAMTNQERELAALGYRLSDENDKERAGTLILITKKWIKQDRMRQNASIMRMINNFPKELRADIKANMERSLGRTIN